jgi:WD40 repeat protein
VGSIEGRVAVQHIDEAQQSKNFTFKCHRDNNDVYAVNSINFHPVHATFATSGSDGAYHFWDKDSKQRLKVWIVAVCITEHIRTVSSHLQILTTILKVSIRCYLSFCGCFGYWNG